MERNSSTPVMEMPIVPVNAEADFANFDVVGTAETFLTDDVYTHRISDAEQIFPQEEAPGDETIVGSNPVEFNMDMIRLLMFLKDEQARNLVASAIAIDAVGQREGIEELTFRHAAANRQIADLETERLLRARGEDEDTEE